MRQLTLTFPIDDAFLESIYHRVRNLGGDTLAWADMVNMDNKGLCVALRDKTRGGDVFDLVLNADAICRGIQVLTTTQPKGVPEDVLQMCRGQAICALNYMDPGLIEEPAIDIIIQLGLFNQIRHHNEYYD